ncbi:MAG: hypothetical protein WA913_08560 [Pricia sp.]
MLEFSDKGQSLQHPIPFLILVSITYPIIAKLPAASPVLNCPDIFCFTFMCRIALSDALLTGGTPSTSKKVNRLSLSLRIRL